MGAPHVSNRDGSCHFDLLPNNHGANFRAFGDSAYLDADLALGWFYPLHDANDLGSGVHPDVRNQRTHAWELESDDSDASALENDFEIAATNFVGELVDAYMSNAISAQLFCILCYYAAKAGVQGVVHEYGMAPGKGSGNYQRHLDSKLGFSGQRSSMYSLQTYGHRKHDLERTEFSIPVRPPHEAIDEEIRSDNSIVGKLQDAVATRNSPQDIFLTSYSPSRISRSSIARGVVHRRRRVFANGLRSRSSKMPSKRVGISGCKPKLFQIPDLRVRDPCFEHQACNIQRQRL